MYQYAAQNQHRAGFVTMRNRVLLILTLVLLALVVFLGIRTITLQSYRTRSEDAYYHSLSSDVASAISVANRLDSTTSSTTSYTLGLVRQYVYSMERVNGMCSSLTGRTYVPQDAFAALYTDLDNYQTLVLGNKKSTVETREMLLTHLNLVQGYINGVLAS